MLSGPIDHQRYETVHLTWSNFVAVPIRNQELPCGYCSNVCEMVTKRLSCENMSSDLRARGRAGRHITSDEALIRMTWYEFFPGKAGTACLRR